MKERDDMIRILSGEASPEEQRVFQQVLKSNVKLMEEFQSLKSGWESATDAMIYRDLDVEAAWSTQRESIQLTDSEDVSPVKRNTILFKWAASVTLIALAVYWMVFQSGATVISTRLAQTQVLELDEGSQVTLNEQTTLEYQMEESIRRLGLSGEAYFRVARDAGRPFVVKTAQGQVTVVGTAFDVKSDETSTWVYVDEGVVDISADGQSLRLEAGQSGLMTAGGVDQLDEVEANATAWYDKSLRFDQVPLHEVLADLESAYHLRFDLDQQRALDCRLTADFKDEQLSHIFEAIGLIFDVSFEQLKGNSYRVKVNGCK